MAQSTSESSPLLILVDGHSLAFRSYFAFAKGRDGGLRTSTGIPTSVCFGFLKSLLQVIETQQPGAIAVAFDLGLPTFRHEADDTYKADRPDTPEDFIPDLKNLKELLSALNLPVLSAPGYEADDLLATLAKQGSQEGYQVKVVTGDRDLFQLVNSDEKISVLYLDHKALKGNKVTGTEVDEDQVAKMLNIRPDQVVDYKALCGDKSDNIPGVKGIGDKTAVKLLSEYGTLANIYQHLDEIKGATQKKLRQGEEAAKHSQFLAQLKFDAPTGIKLSECHLEGFETNDIVPILEKLEFSSFLGKISQLQQQLGGEVIEEVTETPGIPESEDMWFFSAEDTAEAQKQQAALIQVKPQIIDTPKKLSALVERLKSYTDPETPVAWDTETTALEPRDAQLVGIGCCWGTNPADLAYIPLGHNDGTNLDCFKALDTLRPILESDKYPKALQNSKFDRLILRCQGIELAGVVFDTMLASYVLDPEGNHGLGDLANKYLTDIESKSYSDLEIAKGDTIATLDIETVAEYCGLDVFSTFALVPKLREELKEVPDLLSLLLNLEQPLEPVLANMEYLGIRIDTEYLHSLSVQLETDLHKIEQQAYQDAGEEFNLGSPKQLSEILFDKLNLDRRKSSKTKTGYSTNHATLEKLRDDHPVVEAVLEHRTLSKLKSTYVDALPALVREDTKRIYTDFNQTITSTGRLSSSSPNLQNIPIRTAFSRQIRKAFIPKEGWLLVAADYSQIELRILAHLSQEPVLVEAYQTGKDVHTVTAQLLFEKEDVTPEERRLGKTINFGVIYGMGAYRFAREAGVSSVEGREFIDRYRERYTKVFAYLEDMKKSAIAQGYVTTILGRRRYFHFNSSRLLGLRNTNPNQIDLDEIKGLGAYDSQLLRAAANAPIQGSSADIIKLAMIQLHDLLQHYQANLLLQVHDELVFEVPPQEWEFLRPKIKSVMEKALEGQDVAFSVPLIVEVKAGQNWMETK
jgi:DNA polymerase-1